MIRLLILCAALALGLVAEAPAALRGVIRDSQGNAVLNAAVRLHRQESGAVQRTSTDSAGAYTFENLPPGDFILEVEKEGFRGVTRKVRVEGGVVAADVSLEVAGLSQAVVVTAAGAPQLPDEISKAVTVISGDEIRERDEYAVSEIVRAVPGVQIRNSGGPGQLTTFRIRGLRPDAAAILVDGLRFRDASTAQSDASSQFSAMNFINIDRVEVLRGSGSSLYGTNAAAGVINIVTPQGGGPLHGEIQAEAGNLGLYRGRGSIGGGAFHDRLKYTAGLLHLNITDGVDGNDANRSTGGQGFVRFDLTPKITLSERLWASDDFVQLNNSPTTAGIPAANLPAAGIIPAIPLVTYVPGTDDPDSRKGSRFYTSAFILRHSLTPRTSWQASYQRVHSNRVMENGPAGGSFQPATSNYSEYRGDIDTVDVHGTAMPAPWMTLTGGYEFEREHYFDSQDNRLPGTALIRTQTRINQDAHAGYFAAQMGLLDRRLEISLSGRAQAFRLSRPEFQLTGTANNYASVPLKPPPQALTGDVSIAYLLARSRTKLRTHVGNAYRAPSLYERFGGGFYSNPVTGQVGFTPYGDPRLSPDRYNSVDAGIDQYLFAERVRISATWFYSRVVTITGFDSSGVIRPDTDPYGRSFGYINGSGGISRGAEVSVEARPLRTFTASGSYTYTDANLDRDITVAGFFQVFSVPKHTVTLAATKQWTRRFGTTIDLFYGSGYFIPFFTLSGARVFEFPGFTKTDLVGRYRVWENDLHSVHLYAKADNVFNRRYYEAGWLAPQATFVAGIAYSF